ncbi:MAG: hypothetical protein DI574_09470 [Acidovorax sp.]|nr:MAG: hypothetical protein DI574_09470 [Acidovorax sp.]
MALMGAGHGWPPQRYGAWARAPRPRPRPPARRHASPGCARRRAGAPIAPGHRRRLSRRAAGSIGGRAGSTTVGA